MAALQDGTLTVNASTTDVAGNPASASASVIVDTLAPTLTISTIAGDDIINTTEQQAGQTISGTAEVLADSVQLAINLPGLLGMIAGKLRGKIEDQGRLLLK